MTTWQFWRYIIRPPQDNPIYQRMLSQAGPAIPWYVGCAEIFAFVLILPMVAFIGPVYSLGWVIGISSHIARARENGVLDLLSLAPPGPLGASFALAVASMHREGALARISQRSTWSGRLTVMLLVYVTLAPRLAAGESILGTLGALLVLTAALYPDHVQSISLACAAGMLAADFSASRANAQWLAFLLLFTFQAGAYGAALTLYLLLTSDAALQMTGAALAAVLTLLLMREGLFLLLWRALVYRFGAATVLDLANHRAV